MCHACNSQSEFGVMNSGLCVWSATHSMQSLTTRKQDRRINLSFASTMSWHGNPHTLYHMLSLYV